MSSSTAPASVPVACAWMHPCTSSCGNVQRHHDSFCLQRTPAPRVPNNFTSHARPPPAYPEHANIHRARTCRQHAPATDPDDSDDAPLRPANKVAPEHTQHCARMRPHLHTRHATQRARLGAIFEMFCRCAELSRTRVLHALYCSNRRGLRSQLLISRARAPSPRPTHHPAHPPLRNALGALACPTLPVCFFAHKHARKHARAQT